MDPTLVAHQAHRKGPPTLGRAVRRGRFEAWRQLAIETSYKAFLADVPDGQRYLDLAAEVE